MSFRLIYLFLILCAVSACQPKSDPALDRFDKFYSYVIDSDYESVANLMDDQSTLFLNRLTNSDNQNIDSMLSIGQHYRIPYMMTEYFAFRGEQSDSTNLIPAFFNYLGMQDASLFSFTYGYYVEKSKIKRGESTSIPIIKEIDGRSKRNWVRLNTDTGGDYKFDLLYSLQLFEIKRKKYFENIKQSYADINTDEDFLRQYYWQNSGANSAKFNKDQDAISTAKKNLRKSTLESYIDRGLR